MFFLNIIMLFQKEYLAKKTPVDSEIDDEMQQYLVDTYEIDNGLDQFYTRKIFWEW